MKNNLKKFLSSIFISIILICICVTIFSSCGARKTEKNKTETLVKNQSSSTIDLVKKEESNIKIEETTAVDDQNQTTIKKIIFTPLDPTKPASITTYDGKKIYINNAKYQTEETTQKNNTKTQNTNKTNSHHKSKSAQLSKKKSKGKAKIAAKASQSSREAYSIWNLLWLIIPIGIGYYIYKK